MSTRIKDNVLEKDKLEGLRNWLIVSWAVYFISSFSVIFLANFPRGVVLAAALLGIIAAVSSAVFFYKVVYRLYIKKTRILFFVLYILSMFIPFGWIMGVIVLTITVIDVKKELRAA